MAIEVIGQQDKGGQPAVPQAGSQLSASAEGSLADRRGKRYGQVREYYIHWEHVSTVALGECEGHRWNIDSDGQDRLDAMHT